MCPMPLRRFPTGWGFLASLSFTIQHQTEPTVGSAKKDEIGRNALGYEWELWLGFAIRAQAGPS